MQHSNIGLPATAGPFHFNAAMAPTWNNNSPYDLPYALSCMPGYLRDWVSAITTKLEVDPGMALATLLSGMGAGLYGGKVVKRPDDGREPLAFFTVILAGPTTGKTRTHKLVHTAHNAHDIWRYKRYQQARRAASRDTSNSDQTIATPESAARLRSVLLQDTSNRGLLEALEGVGESAAISVHEGQKALESVLFRRHLDTLNVLHDGEGRVTITRGKNDRVSALNAMLTMLVMVQPDIFEAYLAKHGGTARGIGFLARCLFCVVPAFGSPAERWLENPDAYLATYHYKVEAFLKARLAALESGQTDPDEIAFSPDACRLWDELVAEQRRRTTTVCWHVQDAANRAMQNVARIAGIIHSYLGEQGDISRETLEAAWAIVQWHMGQFAMLFPPAPLSSPPPPKPTAQEKQLQREIEDGKAILDCIADACWRTKEPDALKSKVAIRSGLYNQRFRTALMRLVDEGAVLETGEGNQARLRILQAPLGGQLGQASWCFPHAGTL
jgi:hypothetical protein